MTRSLGTATPPRANLMALRNERSGQALDRVNLYLAYIMRPAPIKHSSSVFSWSLAYMASVGLDGISSSCKPSNREG
jgi:hypothetical protein